MVIGYGHVFQVTKGISMSRLYKSYGSKISPGVMLGSQGSKRSFSLGELLLLLTQLQGMVMWLMYIHQLDPLYESYGSKNSPGVIWGHRGQKVIFTKNATSLTVYRVWSCDSCTCISLTPSTKVMGLKIHPGSFGVTGVKKVIFTKKRYFSYKLQGMVMWLMYIHQLDPLYKSYGSKNSPGVIWGHRGQKVIITKNATSPTVYRVWSCDSCTCISLTPSTKVMGLKIHPGSFGVTGVKRLFSLKTLLLLQITG